MDWRISITHFSFFSFSCREQGKSACFRFSVSWHHTPKVETQNWKKLIFIGFSSFRTLLQAVPWLRSRQANPRKSFFQPGWRSKAYLPGPLIRAHSSSVSKATTKPPYLGNIFQFSERWNSITSWFLPSCPSTNKPSNWRAERAPGLEVGNHSHQFSRRSREEFLSRVVTLPHEAAHENETKTRCA